MKQELALQQVFETICQLHMDNKQVSVANIKNKMIISAPLPLITKAISAFKQDPDNYLKSYQENKPRQLEVNSPDITKPSSLEQRVEQLERQVAELSKQLLERSKN
ncbi:hypothetical protein [Catenovulum adriaticum]|uniref:Uncharacterized protein n=1 Tax=Catenovulum adriaticum TaxID=2984846 RepID=A0ABY7AQE8_9ALTE|nr:hypothetical protein [Catenovulum sp. TS8]WAJ70891.1 hypothetical protein OLW01_03515 [Catenovulum sp. TS8]